MAGDKPDVLMVGAKKPVMMKGFEGKVTLHHWLDLKDKDTFVKDMALNVRFAVDDASTVAPQPKTTSHLY